MKKILVIDDDKTTCFLINEVFKKKFNVYCVHTCNDFIDMLNKDKFDIIILDVMLPECLGHELIPYIKIKDEDTKIMIYSATSEKQNENTYKVPYLLKGNGIEELQKVIEKKMGQN